jgi:hypothetical protein
MNTQCPESKLTIYSWPSETVLSPHFSVVINHQPVPVCATGVARFSWWRLRGVINIEVTVEAPLNRVHLRPLSRNNVPEIEGQTIRFSLDQPGNWSLEIDDMMPLFVFANALKRRVRLQMTQASNFSRRDKHTKSTRCTLAAEKQSTSKAAQSFAARSGPPMLKTL